MVFVTMKLLFIIAVTTFIFTNSFAFLNSPTFTADKISTKTSTKMDMIFGKKSQPSQNDGKGEAVTTINGKLVDAKVGEKVSIVAKRAKIPITYSCKKGDCGTCELMINGLIVKACQEKVILDRNGKCDIRTF